MSTLRICLFGPPTVEMDGRRIEVKPRKALALLVYLACTNRVQRRDTLATLLWPEFGQSQARAALRRHLSELGQFAGRHLAGNRPGDGGPGFKPRTMG